jgi:hypothetical protein
LEQNGYQNDLPFEIVAGFHVPFKYRMGFQLVETKWLPKNVLPFKNHWNVPVFGSPIYSDVSGF